MHHFFVLLITMFTFVLSASQIAMPSIDTNILFEEDANRQPGNTERYA